MQAIRAVENAVKRSESIRNPRLIAVLTRKDVIAIAPRLFHSDQEIRREAHLSTAQQAPQALPRFPQAYADQRRTPDAAAPPSQGAQAADRRRRQEVTSLTPERFPKSARLRRRGEFLRVQDGGRKIHTDSFLVFVLPQREPGPMRIGITASRKLGGAVVRNRVKRLVREAFRRHKLLFPAGLDVAFIAKKNAVEVEYDQVVREIEKLCRRL